MFDRGSLPASTRKKLEIALDSLVAILDAIDGDPDFEESDPAEPVGDDEPSLGSTTAVNQDMAWRAPFALGTDLEFDGETAPSADAEPSLGSLSANDDQTSWGAGARDDREAAYDGEPQP